MIVELAAAFLLPTCGWMFTRVIQHGEDIASLKQIAASIAESLERISRHMERLDDRTFRETQRRPSDAD